MITTKFSFAVNRLTLFNDLEKYLQVAPSLASQLQKQY